MTEPGDGPGEAIRGPIDASRTPRYAGPPTFALLPWRTEVSRCDVAVAGVPFDSGTSYRPGARFGPSAVRQGSRLLRPWHPALEVSPLAGQQVADAGDIACNPFNIAEAVAQIEAAAAGLLDGPAICWPSAVTTPSPTRCCGRPGSGSARPRWCTSTRTWTPGRPISGRR